MNTINKSNTGFINLYNKSYRLAAGVFAISNVMDEKEELRTKIKKLSLDIVSMSVRLKDANFYDSKRQIAEIEKNSLELMSMLDISAITGMISKTNASIIKSEFESFIKEMNNYVEGIESEKNISVPNILNENSNLPATIPVLSRENLEGVYNTPRNIEVKNNSNNALGESVNGYKRKETRKTNIFNFIKSHNNVTIKDIVPHIVGCSEKTIQRELVDLINEGRISKSGERRWTRYSVI